MTNEIQHAGGRTDLQESEIEEIVDERVDGIREQRNDLEQRIEELENEFLQPPIVEAVLVRSGLSKDRAEDLVETMQDVQTELGDSDV
jgi:hypothetical protein